MGRTIVSAISTRHKLRGLRYVHSERNPAVNDEMKAVGVDMVDQFSRLTEMSFELAELYDTGDVTLAGHYFYTKIVPVFEAMRRADATVSTVLIKEIKRDALLFKP